MEADESLHDVWAHWSYIWAQKILRLSAKKSSIERKKILDWAHFTLAIYLRKKIKIIKFLRNYYKNDL
jgi:hypothetical protein